MKPNVIALTETKLTQSRMSANINIYGYNFIHHDSKTCAGGVAFYVEESLKYVQSIKTSLNLDNVEDLWIELTINKKTYLIERNRKLCTKVDYFLFGHKLSWATAHFVRCNGMHNLTNIIY